MNNQQAHAIEGRIGFLGAGSIVEAMLSGILKKGLFSPDQIYVTNRSNSERLDLLAKTYGVHTTHDKMDVVKAADILILAMKPKD